MCLATEMYQIISVKIYMPQIKQDLAKSGLTLPTSTILSTCGLTPKVALDEPHDKSQVVISKFHTSEVTFGLWSVPF
jgi:hypothetical protein